MSLYGFDAKGDFQRLTTKMAGRRINTAVPEESLLVTKSLGTVPHTGGKLIKPGSAPHKVLIDWIRGGALYDEGEIAEPTAMCPRSQRFRHPMTTRFRSMRRKALRLRKTEGRHSC